MENTVAVVNDDTQLAAVFEEDGVPIEIIEESTPPELNTPELQDPEPKPLTPEQIAHHQKQLRIKALKLEKMHKDAGIRHAKNKVAKVARRKNRVH